MQPLFKRKIISISVIILGIVIATAFQCHTLRHLPLFDCLPYKKGNYLLQQMKVPPGAIPDSSVVTFKYKKNNKIIEFDAMHFPADFDSTYQYINRYDKLIRKGTATPAISDFALLTLSGTDTTQEILQQQNKYILVLAKDFQNWKFRKTDFDNMVKVAKNNLPIFVASPEATNAKSLFPQNITLLNLDAVVEKTAARCNPTYFLLEGDHILEKKSYTDIDAFTKELNEK